MIAKIMFDSACCKTGKRDKNCKRFYKEKKDKSLAEKINLLSSIPNMGKPVLTDKKEITTGIYWRETLDPDRDLKRIAGVKEGLHQYYKHEMTIARASLNTGRVMEKIGINERRWEPENDKDLTFIIIDRKPHLNRNGLVFILKWVGRLLIVTNNPEHPGYAIKDRYGNLDMIGYNGDIDFEDLFCKLKLTYGIDRLTIQSGGTLNTCLMRKGLIDHICIFIAPLAVGGKDAASLLD